MIANRYCSCLRRVKERTISVITSTRFHPPDKQEGLGDINWRLKSLRDINLMRSQSPVKKFYLDTTFTASGT
jgi:hypothetical protein